MPLESPFHARIAPLCTSYAWKQWGGYYAVNHFGDTHLSRPEMGSAVSLPPARIRRAEGSDHGGPTGWSHEARKLS